MKQNQKGFSAVEAILIIIVVALIAAAGWYVWSKNKKDDKQNDTHTSQSSEESKHQEDTTPVFSTLPSNWTEYKSDSDGLRFGYPKEWGTLDLEKSTVRITATATSMMTAVYQNDSLNLQGRTMLTISKKEGFSVVARKYGATIKRSADGKSWVVSEVNPANVGNDKVGDTYKTKEVKVNGGTALDLSFVDEDCTHSRWLLELKNSYAEVSIPELCPNDGTLPTQANKDAYAKVIGDFVKSITVY